MSDLLTLYSHIWIKLFINALPSPWKTLVLLPHDFPDIFQHSVQATPKAAFRDSDTAQMWTYGILCFSLSTGAQIVVQYLTLKFTSLCFSIKI